MGHHPLVGRLIQAVIVGVLMPWLVYQLGKRTFGRKAGLASAAAISVYIYLVYYSACLMTESFYIVALLWALGALQRISEEAEEQESKGTGKLRGKWVELGLAWGVAVLLRQQALLFVPVFLGWILWATWGRIRIRAFLQSALISIAIVAAFILPGTIRNALVYDRFLPLNSNVGWTLFAANHPQQGNRHYPGNCS